MSGNRLGAGLGYGSDLDFLECDVTMAARRAVRDAISRSCLYDSFEIQDMKDPGRMLENILREVDYSGL